MLVCLGVMCVICIYMYMCRCAGWLMRNWCHVVICEYICTFMLYSLWKRISLQDRVYLYIYISREDVLPKPNQWLSCYQGGLSRGSGTLWIWAGLTKCHDACKDHIGASLKLLGRMPIHQLLDEGVSLQTAPHIEKVRRNERLIDMTAYLGSLSGGMMSGRILLVRETTERSCPSRCAVCRIAQHLETSCSQPRRKPFRII